VQEAFGIVIIAVTLIAAVIAVVSLVSSRKAYDEIGRGAMSLRDERDAPPPDPPASGPVAAAQREDEIRQLLTARNARRVRRGQAPVDVDDELRRLTAPSPAPADAGLREEVRQLVQARNERRARAGKPALDVEAEVERQLRELSG